MNYRLPQIFLNTNDNVDIGQKYKTDDKYKLVIASSLTNTSIKLILNVKKQHVTGLIQFQLR